MKKTFRLLWLILALSVAAPVMPVLLTGCKTATLEPGGAYAPTNSVSGVSAAPDLAFFQVDSAYDLAYSAIDAAFKFERDNRLYLWGLTPTIKHTLDSIRPQAVAADQEYLAARAAYMAMPTPAGLSLLQTVLAKTQQLMAAAQAAVAKKGP